MGVLALFNPPSCDDFDLHQTRIAELLAKKSDHHHPGSIRPKHRPHDAARIRAAGSCVAVLDECPEFA